MAAVRLLRDHKFTAVLVDEKPVSSHKAVVEEMRELGTPCFFGERIFEALEAELYSALVLSPGIPTDHPFVTASAKQCREVIGELELGFRFARDKIIAVTGTNGKTTTVHLAAKMLQAGGRTARPVGNVGFPLCEAVRNNSHESEPGCLVVEVSSYQLETVRNFHPEVAVLLNITPDHLRRHGTMEEYCKAKYRITENQTGEDLLILNADEESGRELTDKTLARVWSISMNRPVSCGAYLEGQELRLNLDKDERLLYRSEIPIPGLHNIQDILAAALCSKALGISNQDIAHAVREFQGVEHRMERVAGHQGVDFVNDSKATNLDSLEKALSSYSRPVILIAGGRDKGDDYHRLNNLITRNVRQLVLMGEAAPLMLKAWGNLTPAIEVSSMRDAVQAAWKASLPGDVVLLSPGGSSFDAFRDFEQRGQIFKQEINRLVASLASE